MIWSFGVAVIFTVITLCLVHNMARVSTAEQKMSSAILAMISAAVAGVSGIITLVLFVARALS